MASGPKPRDAAGYDANVTAACERTLLTLLGAFGNLKNTLRLVGGLVPRYLTPEAPPDVPAHVGTSDVDVVLNLQVIAEGEGYAALADQLTARGFRRFVNAEGRSSSWRWIRQIDAQMAVLVEFLRDAGDEQPGRVVTIDGERVSALAMKHAGIVNEWFESREITAPLLDGRGTSTEIVRFADVPAFVVLKALALDDRIENKDAADLIHVIRYAGSLDQVADMFVRRIHSSQHGAAITAGLTALRRRFCDDEHGPGHEKAGAICYARFHVADGDDDRLLREQRFASGLIEALLDRISAAESCGTSSER
ncbi:hypothetical protein [Cupriavidus plantarum]|uniref:Nucleotidyltransferase AbiEii toxin of type IV toxin-antitoxin system n=1 Tax=Cupriavidus plantarum TaxID=942865 RepID=A0A316EPX1_9BURK|nr:hypothetical protein [Cupriavidus plantarum]PWK33510.1 hypothetical protein C7419_104185 [Cupriavidus plantarum]